jgi:hypothetical protein
MVRRVLTCNAPFFLRAIKEVVMTTRRIVENPLFIFFLCLLFLFGCEKDEKCSDIMCDAECRESGNAWGQCTSGGACECGNPENCFDGKDNDLDGIVDCWDSDCGFEGATELSCGDGIDNDCDGNIDCYDIDDCGSDPVCGGCEDTTCNAECYDACDADECNSSCVASGHASGSCVGDTCQCSDACSSHDQCPAAKLCYHGECQDPWGKEYRFTIVDGHLPERRWWSGDCYDSPCGPPDTVVRLWVDDSLCETSEASDTYNPQWNKECNFSVNADTKWQWFMVDIDIVSDDTIASMEAKEVIGLSTLRGGGASWYVEYEGEIYYIINISIEPR